MLLNDAFHAQIQARAEASQKRRLAMTVEWPVGISFVTNDTKDV